MQIVIDIPDEKYERLVYQDIISLRSYVENGIVLPKGHGRLIDADALIDTLGCSDRDIYCRATIEEDAKAIIEADRSEEE